MKFQNPSLNSVTDGRTNGRTDKPKAICSPLFQSWGHKKYIATKACVLKLPIIYKLFYART